MIKKLIVRNHDLDFCNIIIRKSDVEEDPKCSSQKMSK